MNFFTKKLVYFLLLPTILTSTFCAAGIWEKLCCCCIKQDKKSSAATVKIYSTNTSNYERTIAIDWLPNPTTLVLKAVAHKVNIQAKTTLDSASCSVTYKSVAKCNKSLVCPAVDWRCDSNGKIVTLLLDRNIDLPNTLECLVTIPKTVQHLQIVTDRGNHAVFNVAAKTIKDLIKDNMLMGYAKSVANILQQT